MSKFYCCTHGVQPVVRLLWACLLLTGLPAFAQPELVRGPQPLPPYPGKDAYVTLNGKLYFAATTAAHGAELFRSDPKVKEISLVKDINPGPSSSSPGELMRLGNGILFTAADGLYRSDGTEAGTVRLKVSGSWPHSLVNADGTAFFMIDAGSNVQIWKSNGTAAGTTLVKEVGTADSQFVTPGLTAVGGIVFFPGYETTHGIELWKSDGTAAGTVMVKDIYPGGPTNPDNPEANSSAPGSLTAFKGALYFSANNGAHGRELWKSDGTATGTTLVKDLAAPGAEGGAGDGNAQPSQFTVAGDALFLVTTPVRYGAEVYKTDGTAAGTVRVAAHYLSGLDAASSVFGMTAVGNTVYYGVLTDSPSIGTSVGLHKTDGTVTGSVQVYDFSGAAGASGGFVKEGVLGNFTDVNGVLYFTASDGLVGSEVWKTDGTADGTVYLPEVAPGDGDSNPTRLVNLNGVLFFSASPDPQALRQWKFDPGQPFTLAIRINAGGGEGYIKQEPPISNPLVPFLYQYFAPDAYFSGGNVTNPKPDAPASVDEARRWGAFSYNIPVTNGTYAVQLRSIEPYWGVTVPGGQGSRKFNVDMEGSRKVTEFDIFHAAGGALVPVWQSFRITVTDGTLNLDFTQGSADNAIISAIEVLPTVAANRPPVITPINDTTITLGSTLAFTAKATDPDGDLLSFELNGGFNRDDAVVDPQTGAIAFAPTQVGMYPLAVVVTDNGYGQGEAVERFMVTVTEPGAVRVNAGGNGYSAADGRRFAGDAYFAGGTVSLATALDIGGTEEDSLYQTGRHGAFSYNFPTGNGSYDVVLHFAETYWGNVVPGGAESRKFHVNLEGVRKLTDYDIFARAGGALRSTQETFRVDVTDGTLNVAFLKGAADNPAVKAIEVLAAGSGLAVNAGGVGYVSLEGTRFSGDGYYTSGRPSSTIQPFEIEGTEDDALYQDGRVGAFSYDLPTGDGTFDVTLYFAETYWGYAAGRGGAGSRKFNVDIEGQRKLTDYDIFQKAGGALKARQETFRALVTDGVLNLDFLKGSADLPQVSAIRVTPVPGAARTAAKDAADGAQTVRLYPNPVRTTLTVRLPFPAAGVTGSAVLTTTGRELLRDAHRVQGEYELEIPVGQLNGGLYLLRVESAGGRRIRRFVKGE